MVGPEEGAAPAEEAAQAVEADPVEADPVDAAAPVGADESIGACIGLVYSELRSASVRFPKVDG